MLSRQAILEYQEIYKREFGKDISQEEVLKQGTKLLGLFKLIYAPIPKEWLKKTKNIVKEENKT